VLSLLLPLVDATDGGLTRLWPLFGLAVALVAGSVWWEAATVRRGGQPLLHPRLTHTSGYMPGLAIGLLYFIGFTGIWLVLALFFQDGLGYSPLRSGLAVTPFALGVAASAMVSGPLLLAGLGGGMVTSPNVTLTLESVPVPMAGAAGGALQTAQRIGSAIGTALLLSFFYRALTGGGHNWPKAVSDALLCACGLMLLALVLAVAELWRRRSRHDRPVTPHTLAHRLDVV